jgi:hypothetical protein
LGRTPMVLGYADAVDFWKILQISGWGIRRHSDRSSIVV